MLSVNTSSEAILILPDIRSVLNVGSIFRTADAVGVSGVYLTGYTPTPLDRFGRIRKDFAKSALGAEKTVPWWTSSDLISLIIDLKKQGYQIVSVEQHQNSQPYYGATYGKKVAFILGNEVDGVDEAVLDLSDLVVEIPMLGKKESLNVAVATGVVLYNYFFK